MDSTTDDDREDSGAMQEAPVTRSPDGAALNSDVEGDIESDDWYTETKVTTTSGICSGGEDAVTQHAGEEEDVDCDPSEDNEGGTDGDALLLREKNRAKRQQLRERLAAAKAKLSRDWATTTKNWDALTSVEMEALALDEEALKKLRVYGWNFGTYAFSDDVVYTTCTDMTCCIIFLDSSTHPTRTEAYPGLYSGGYRPTAEVLELEESPLRLFFYFMPPRLWRRIALESNRYYHQHLNERVDRMYAAQLAKGGEMTRDDILLRETKSHKKFKRRPFCTASAC
ncbi:hypothetical protein Pcac1_g2878 [Phytophthora cactorum]|nr:hypothetical protein Pcac1_g2878 [Phytophthora cactorum]